MYTDWKELIFANFALESANSKGWHALRCPVCNDKKQRAAFIFGDDTWGYNCFRGKCRHRINYSPIESPDSVIGIISTLFSSVGLRIDDWSHLLYDNLTDFKPSIIEKEPIVLLDPQEIKLPYAAHELLSANPDNIKTTWAIDYLMDRGVDPTSSPYFITNAPPPKDAMNFRNRLIIPFYYKEKLIFYQGAWFHPEWSTKTKYLNTNLTTRDSIFYNMDEIDRNTDEPLLIVEGAFDAQWYTNTIGTLSNTLTEQQVERLRRSPRRKILIPDHDKAGAKMVKTAIDNEWDVSFPEWFGVCKDVDDAVRKYGRLRAMSLIYEGLNTTVTEKEVVIAFLEST